jgi:putative transcriptional regulator
MSQEITYKNQFLIAMPGLEDDNFGHAVTLMCEHSDEGAVGLVINRPIELKLSDMMAQMGLEHDALEQEQTVFWGGPVQPERGFVIHKAPAGWESCMPVTESLYITTSRGILSAIGAGKGPKDYIVVLGYSGWGAGQLETEILNNSWLNTPVDQAIIFKTPTRERWQAATRLLGVDVTQLSSGAGHS